MASYADIDYYKNDWKGFDPEDDEELQKYLDRAATDIDVKTAYSFNFDDLIDVQKKLVKDANCSQAEFYLKNGEDDLKGKFSPVKIGQFQISGVSTKYQVLSDRSCSYLSAAGLLYRGLCS